MTLGQRIAERRKILGMSQEMLGEKLGVSRQAISKWEADGAMPEIDKLIAMSRLFGVTVGWLLGTEDAHAAADGISEDQMKTIEELIRRYSRPQKGAKAESGTAAVAVCALCLGLLSLIWSLGNRFSVFPDYDAQLSSLSRENSIIQGQLEDLSGKIQELAEGEKLISEFQTKVTAWQDYRGASVRVSMVPKTIRPDDQVYLSVLLDGQQVQNVLCQYDGLSYTAVVELPATDGYAYYVRVVHADGTQEQNTLISEEISDHTTPVYLEAVLACHADLDVMTWDFSGRGNLEVTAFVAANAPGVMAEGDWPTWKRLELVLLRNGRELSRADHLEQAKAWMDENVIYMTPEITTEEKYMDMLWLNCDLGTLTYKLTDLAEGDVIELRIEAELSNGLTAENSGSVWEFRDGTLAHVS